MLALPRVPGILAGFPFPPIIMVQITLSEWSKKNKVPQRTAVSWVHKKKLKAVRKRVQVATTHMRTVNTYVLDDKATVPGVSKGK